MYTFSSMVIVTTAVLPYKNCSQKLPCCKHDHIAECVQVRASTTTSTRFPGVSMYCIHKVKECLRLGRCGYNYVCRCTQVASCFVQSKWKQHFRLWENKVQSRIWRDIQGNSQGVLRSLTTITFGCLQHSYEKCITQLLLHAQVSYHLAQFLCHTNRSFLNLSSLSYWEFTWQWRTSTNVKFVYRYF